MLAQMPAWAQPFAHSGITLAAVTAVGLNLLFNGAGGGAEAPAAHAREPVLPEVAIS
jgi:xanthine/uracil permease